MDSQLALTGIEQLLRQHQRQALSSLEKMILEQVLLGRRYVEIASDFGYTEGHIKDTGSQLWQRLSEVMGERITKNTCRLVLQRFFTPSDPESGWVNFPSTNFPVAAASRTANQTVGQTVLEHSQSSQLRNQGFANQNFIGRDASLVDLQQLTRRGAKLIVIQGEGGLGKTTLARHYLHSQGFELILELLMAKDASHLTPAEKVVEEWLQQDFQQEAGLDFGVALGRLQRLLPTRRLGVLIDNLEPALDQEGRILAPYRSYVELLRVLSASRGEVVVLVTSRDRLCEPDLTVTHYRLPRLGLPAWEQFFAAQGLSLDELDLAALAEMHHAYGGNAKAMGLLSGLICEDFQGQTAAYWQANRQDLLAVTDLKHLVAGQFDRLQQLDPRAYRLLCRLGCYRFQDQPTLPLTGLTSLLWDVPAEQQRSVVQALRNRSLLEFEVNSESGGQFWLHPVIQLEARSRLCQSSDGETAHRQAAGFWSSSVTTIENSQTALQALEAHTHYLAIQDYQAAAGVLLQSRHNQWQQYLSLGSMLYRLGLIQPVWRAIIQVIEHLPPNPQLSELSNLLADIYWITGNVQQAIASQEQALKLARAADSSQFDPDSRQFYYLKMLEVDALLSLGLYNIDLWELASAATYFQSVIEQADQSPHQRWADKACACLALVNAALGKRETATSLARGLEQVIVTTPLGKPSGRFAYFIQILGQTYVTLEDFERAGQMFQLALEFSQSGHYTQTKARTLNGLAMMTRQQGKLEQALEYHQLAITLLTEIGAKCDLAEAYFQLALTQLTTSTDRCASQESAQRAIELFNEINAPKQVAKVRTGLS